MIERRVATLETESPKSEAGNFSIDGHRFPMSRFELFARLLRTSPIDYVRARLALLNDLGRATREYVQLLNDPILNGEGMPKGKECVVEIPGFLAGGWSYFYMDRCFRQTGRETVHLPLLANSDIEPIPVLAERFLRLAKKKRLETGIKVTAVGDSRGGYVLWAAAKLSPLDFAENVGTANILGAPPPQEVNPDIGWAYLLTQVIFGADDFRLIEEMKDDWSLPRAPGLKVILVVGEDDPIVKRRDLPQQEGEYRLKRISHFGMTVNPRIFRIIGRHLNGYQAAA